jgi:CubicO group peptidase (beta-lactamase class C family)
MAEDQSACGLERSVAAAAEQNDFTGSIVVSHRGHAVVTLYRGEISEIGSGPIDEKTRFNLASVSKIFTAVAIGQLIDRGKLRLDEPVGDVVKGLTDAARHVTIRQLLNHTSGLGDFFKPENMPAMLKARSASELLPLIREESPAFVPGSRFSYSNSGFLLLGIAIERVSGMTYGEYLRRNIFLPAGMTSTGLDPQPLATLALGMTYAEMGPAASAPTSGNGLVVVGPGGGEMSGGEAQRPRTLRVAPGAREGYGSPAGGMYSTPTDLNKFAAALENGKLLFRQTLDEFTFPQVQVSPATASGPARYYGFGFGFSDVSGTRWIGHNGGTPGANVEYWFDPSGEWTVAVLSNRDPPVATQMMRQIRLIMRGPVAAGSVCK